MAEKIIRDPVHDVIAFRLERPVDALLFGLLNAAEVQRLRRVRQLGMTHLAYPGADHSRYSHSLGVMETARQMLQQLERSFAVSEEDQTVCLAASLLHDLGHGPLSHVFERVSGMNHEDLTRWIVLEPDSEVHRILAGRDRSLPKRVANFMQARPKRTFLNDLYSSQLDADRLDYLLRDNLMTGSRYGGYDLRWLLHALTVDERNDRLAVTWKGVSALEAYLQSRFHMYRNVYFHKVVRSTEGMVRLALQRARRLAVQERLEWPARDDPVRQSLLGRRLSIAEFTDLDDVSVLHCFKLWMRAQDPVLAGLCRGLMFRRVYKTIDLSWLAEPGRADRLADRARRAVADAGGEPDYDLFYDRPNEMPYETSRARGDDGACEIPIRSADGSTVPFASISPLTQALNRQLIFRRLHVAEPFKPVVEKALAPDLPPDGHE